MRKSARRHELSTGYKRDGGVSARKWGRRKERRAASARHSDPDLPALDNPWPINLRRGRKLIREQSVAGRRARTDNQPKARISPSGR